MKSAVDVEWIEEYIRRMRQTIHIISVLDFKDRYLLEREVEGIEKMLSYWRMSDGFTREIGVGSLKDHQ